MRSWVGSAALTVVVGGPLPKVACGRRRGVIVVHKSCLGAELLEILLCNSFFCIIFTYTTSACFNIFFPPHKIAINFISLCFVKQNKKLWFNSKVP